MGVQGNRRQVGRTVQATGAAVLCLVLAAALGGCGNDRPVPVASRADLPPPQEGASAGTAPVTAPPVASPGARPGQVPPADEAGQETALAVARSFDQADPADPEEVMGLHRGAVETLLGRPGLVRHEAPAEVWQYQSGGCVLDVFMYEASADYEVVYLEARDGKAIAAAAAVCLGAVLDERRRQPTS